MYKVLLVTLFLSSTLANDDTGFRHITRVYNDCHNSKGFYQCLKRKAILFFDRAARMDVIPLMNGIDVVKTTPSEVPAISENEIDVLSPRNMNKDEALTKILCAKIASFVNSRTVRVSLPRFSGRDLSKGIEEVDEYVGAIEQGRSGTDAAAPLEEDYYGNIMNAVKMMLPIMTGLMTFKGMLFSFLSMVISKIIFILWVLEMKRGVEVHS